MTSEDPLTYDSPPGICWTRANIAEVTPGILTPLGWSFYGPLVDVASRRGFAGLGIIPRSATSYPDDPALQIFGVFHGRAVLNLNTLRAMMSGFPGVSGDDVERDIAGSAREGITDRSYGWRAGSVALKAPMTLPRSGKAAAAVLATTRSWWSTRFGPGGIVDGTSPRVALREATERFGDAVVADSRARMLYQGTSSPVVALAEKAGRPDLSALLLAAPGDLEETTVAADLRRLAAGTLSMDAFVAHHGYHGPNAGDIMAQSWRENAAPLQRLIEKMGPEPRNESRRDEGTRAAAVADILATLPRHRRPGARLVLRMTPSAARGLEQSKTAMVMSLDGARASARARGAELVASGRLDHPDDAFYCFLDELLEDNDLDLRGPVSARRANHERHHSIELTKTTWVGDPPTRPAAASTASTVTEVQGVGASSGVVEGPVRVILDAGATSEVDDGDILVCPVTDPSWVSLMMLAGALVIDIGGMASHGAIVARALGVPCVIGTETGTADLRDGDLVRVDGGAGIVTVLKRNEDTS